MKNQDANLGKIEDGDLVGPQGRDDRDDDVIEINEEDLLEEEDLADQGDLDFEPELG